MVLRFNRNGACPARRRGVQPLATSNSRTDTSAASFNARSRRANAGRKSDSNPI
ncbi:hypothetical protein LDL08_11555 [Nonomuraea glycinis]|uniref:hypothetical protein n=1 Tax=Nonomuraea glycinis TaxID=2047744 RepID=UPI001666D358|nr:hypothetical protein [Nonomuraea glycinis]MCA2176821.1 hypothetical protein [Nonomuraea glycinis]